MNASDAAAIANAHAAVSQAYSAIASEKVAYQQLWASWIGGVLSLTVAIALGVATLVQTERLRRAKLETAAIQIRDALSRMEAGFKFYDEIHSIPDVRVFGNAPIAAHAADIREAAGSGIDSASLSSIARRAREWANATNDRVTKLLTPDQPALTPQELSMRLSIERTMLESLKIEIDGWLAKPT